MAEAGPSEPTALEARSSKVAEPCSQFVEERARELSDDRAERVIESVIGYVAKAKGFDGIEASAMDCIKQSMHDVLDSLLIHTHELAMVARRRTPSVLDGYVSLQQQVGTRLRADALRKYAKQRRVKPRTLHVSEQRGKRTSEWLAPCDQWLPSDEEEEGVEGGFKAERRDIRRRRKHFKHAADEIPTHLPHFPPKHTWLATPSFPIRSQDTVDPLTYLDIKVSSTRLTEASLRNLISMTDAAANQKLPAQPTAHSDTLTPSASTGSLFKTDVFTRGAGFSPRASLPGDMSSSSIPPTSATSPATPDEDGKRPRRSKPISLRLRTSSTAQSISNPTPASSATDVAWPDRRRDSSVQRPSMSFSARTPSSLRPSTPLMSPAIASLRRGTTGGGGSWSALPSHSYFTWGPPTPGAAGLDMPPGTPLTPGGFVYPPTPSNIYAPGNPYDTTAAQAYAEEDDVAAKAALPAIVNYKRSWYRRHNTVKREQSG